MSSLDYPPLCRPPSSSRVSKRKAEFTHFISETERSVRDATWLSQCRRIFKEMLIAGEEFKVKLNILS